MRDIDNAAATSRSLADWIARESGLPFSEDQLQQVALPDHLQLNVCVTTLDGRFIAQGRDLIALRRQVRKTSQTPGTSTRFGETYRAWEYGPLPIQRIVERGNVKFTVYPAIVPSGDGVIIVELATALEAEMSMRQGLLRLAMLALPQQVKFAQQAFKAKRDLVLLSRGLQENRPLAEIFAERVFLDCFLGATSPSPRTRQEFEDLLATHRARVGEVVERLATTLLEILQLQHSVHQDLGKTTGAATQAAVEDIRLQLGDLLGEGFLVATPLPWFEHLPRYLRAMSRRVERLSANPRRDAESQRKLAPFLAAYSELSKQHAGSTRPHLERLRWMLEEYRVSLFAQELKTSIPVSDNRLAEQVRLTREETNR